MIEIEMKTFFYSSSANSLFSELFSWFISFFISTISDFRDSILSMIERYLLSPTKFKTFFSFVLEKKLSNNTKLKRLIRLNSLINVGSGQEFTIRQFAEKIKELTASNKKLKFNKKFPDGTKRKVLDISLMKKLGWKSKINLTNGLSSTIKWYKSHY